VGKAGWTALLWRPGRNIPGGSGVATGEEPLFLRGFDSSIALIEEGANSRFGGGMRLTGPTRHAVKTSRQISSVSGCGYGNRCTESALKEYWRKMIGDRSKCLQKRSGLWTEVRALRHPAFRLRRLILGMGPPFRHEHWKGFGLIGQKMNLIDHKDISDQYFVRVGSCDFVDRP